jgi:hypothetical protein
MTCGRNFKTKQSLLDHTNRHLGVKPYMCEICGRGFITKGIEIRVLKNQSYVVYWIISRLMQSASKSAHRFGQQEVLLQSVQQNVRLKKLPPDTLTYTHRRETLYLRGKRNIVRLNFC